MSKFDPQLRLLFQAAGLEPDHLRAVAEPEKPTTRPPEGMVDVMIEFTGDAADLKPLNMVGPSEVVHATKGYKIIGGRLALADAYRAGLLEHVTRVELTKRIGTELHRSVREIRARDEHNQPIEGLTGKGVIVATIDLGIDYVHHSFRKKDGTTRILHFWDQLAPPADPNARWPAGVPTMPPHFLGGLEYTAAQIDAEISRQEGAKTDTERTAVISRLGEHGTQVLGIAAGDGSQREICHPENTFVGVAPEADLIVVRLAPEEPTGGSVAALHALQYVLERAGNRPLVVNMSWGDSIGPRDGSTLLERAIDAMLVGSRGRVMVTSSGNEGAVPKHATAEVPSSGTRSVTFPFKLEGRRGTELIDIWFPGDARVTLQVTSPLGPVNPVPATHLDAPSSWPINPGDPPSRKPMVDIVPVFHDAGNGKNRYQVVLRGNGGVLPGSAWALVFTNVGEAPANVDAWIQRDHLSAFTDHVSDLWTITTPGTSRETITVGAYVSGEPGKGGPLAGFSSRGGEMEPGRYKPELVAPGQGIITPAAGIGVDRACCDWCYHFYKSAGQGTSLAAPHVAGAIALMLQKNPGLTHVDVRALLIRGAKAPEHEAVPNGRWGHGMLNVRATLDFTPLPEAPPQTTPTGDGPTPGIRALPAAGIESTSPSARDASHAASNGLAPRADLPHFTAPAFQALWRELLATEAGRTWAALVATHVDEVRRLVNTHRRMAGAWHRNGGPALVRAVLGAVHRRDLPLPDHLAGRPAADAIGRIADALARYGSPALAADAAHHRPALLALAGLSLDQMVERLRAAA